MSFSKHNVEKYMFRFERGETVTVDDKEYSLGGGHILFVLDCATFTLLSESDWGVYGYRWGVSSGETFKQLMCRIGGNYLCNKISNRIEIDWEKTENNAIEAFNLYAKNKRCKKGFLIELQFVDRNEVRFYDFMEKYVNDSEACYFHKDFPLKAKIVVAIFEKYFIPQLKKEIE